MLFCGGGGGDVLVGGGGGGGDVLVGGGGGGGDVSDGGGGDVLVGGGGKASVEGGGSVDAVTIPQPKLNPNNIIRKRMIRLSIVLSFEIEKKR
jgi:hypothetical protein